MDKRTRIILITLVSLLAACSEAPTATPADSRTGAALPPAETATSVSPSTTATLTPLLVVTSTNTPLPTSTATPTLTATPTIDVFAPLILVTQTVDPELSARGWLILESAELGIEFEYPPPSGNGTYTVAYEYTVWPRREGDPTGTSVIWSIEAPFDSDYSWHRAHIAGGVSEDSAAGRMTGPLDIVRFRRHRGSYYLDLPNDRQFEVTPLRVIRHPAGVYAMVYNPYLALGEFWPDELVAIIYLPEGHHPDIEVLNIQFIDEISLATIEEVVLSVRFTH